MRSPSEMTPDELKVALNGVDTLLRFQAYTPGGLFVILLGKFRDDVRDALSMATEEPVQRGTLRLALDKLDPIEIGTVGGAVMILRQPRFTRIMDDPMLPQMLEAFEDDVNQEKHERTAGQAKTPADAKAS
jgi:hypothetical protein